MVAGGEKPQERERKGKEQTSKDSEKEIHGGKWEKTRPRESHTGRGKSRKDRTERRLGVRRDLSMQSSGVGERLGVSCSPQETAGTNWVLK